MKKTRKIMLLVLLLSLASLLAACLCACSDGMNGTNGKDGANGKSAYEIWLDEGYTGTQSDFLDWLKGKDGSDGTGGNGSDGKDGQDGKDGADGKDGQDGKDGKSAYQIWLDNGHTGTETDFLEWLKGEDGKDGTNGSNGQDGSKGDKGDKGETGVQGEKGENGSNGKDGADGKSAYQIFKEQYPYYQGTEEQWLIALVNGNLRIQAVTFQSEVADDITKYVLNGYALTDIPAVPEKEGQTSAKWNITDFSNITADMTVTAEYDMRKYVTFHNDYTEDEDIKITVNYGEAITNVPEVTAKIGNSGVWSVTDFSRIAEDMQVNAVYETIGLQFTLINQQTQYRVSKGEMDIATEELFIPAYHENKPVTVIDTNAFYTEDYDNRLQFKIAYLPETITEIRQNAFKYCDKLTSITLSDGLINIGDDAFYECHNIKRINYLGNIEDWCKINGLHYLMREEQYNTLGFELFISGKEIAGNLILPNNILEIPANAFYYCNKITAVTIPNGITAIGGYAFSGCSNLLSIKIPNSVTHIFEYAFSNSGLTSIVIPNSVTDIDDGAFKGCSNLTSVSIPNSVDYINYTTFENCNNLTTVIIDPHKYEDYNWDAQTTEIRVQLNISYNAFKNCSKLETIYFKGTQKEFAQVNINPDGNTSFTDAMVYYYSETKPTDDGYYWHYDRDGVTPALWGKED